MVNMLGQQTSVVEAAHGLTYGSADYANNSFVDVLSIKLGTHNLRKGTN